VSWLGKTAFSPNEQGFGFGLFSFGFVTNKTERSEAFLFPLSFYGSSSFTWPIKIFNILTTD
jgi:hypothetical protein